MRNLEEAFHILSDYHRQHDLRLVPISVDRLGEIIVKRGYVQSLALLKVKYKRRQILGGVKFYEKIYGGVANCSVEIYYNDELPKDLERAVVCKEMCHAILDEDGERVTTADDLVPHIQALNSNILTTAGVQSEFLAELLAVELLMPYELRCHHLDDYRQGKITAGELALRYWVPPFFVELAMHQGLLQHIDKYREKRIQLG